MSHSSHRRIAAFNAQTGALIAAFNPPVNYHVNALVATNTTVYAGGEFQDVGTQVRQGLAAFNASNGALLNWAPAATGGDDYALLAAVSPEFDPLGFSLPNGTILTCIGTLTDGEGISLFDSAGEVPLPEQLGYEHRA